MTSCATFYNLTDKLDIIIKFAPNPNSNHNFSQSTDNSTLPQSPQLHNHSNFQQQPRLINAISAGLDFHLKHCLLCQSCSSSAAKALLSNFIIYCNSVLYGSSSIALICKSSMAHLLSPSYENMMTPVFRTLPWLLLYCSQDIILLSYKALHIWVTSFMADLLHRSTPSHSLKHEPPLPCPYNILRKPGVT